jgi:hypothetical protein
MRSWIADLLRDVANWIDPYDVEVKLRCPNTLSPNAFVAWLFWQGAFSDAFRREYLGR